MANTTWNPADKTAGVTLGGTNNLTASASAASNGVRAIDRQASGKFYFEYTLTTIGGTPGVGFATAAAALGGALYTNGALGLQAYSNGSVYLNGSSVASIGAVSAGGLVCVAIDTTNDLAWVRNGAAGNWNNNAAYNPATGTGGLSLAAFAGGVIPVYPAITFGTGSASITANFGDSAFTGAVPAGFTSGFTAGATPTLYAVNTQAALEQWSRGTPVAQATQLAVEEWATVAVGNVQALATQVSLEMWASVAQQVVGGASSPGFVVIMA